MDSKDRLAEAGLCKCSLTDFLYNHNEISIAGNQLPRTQFKSPDHTKSKLSITSSMKMNQALSAKKASVGLSNVPCQTSRQMAQNKVSEFSLVDKEDKVSVSLRRRQSENIVKPKIITTSVRYPLVAKQVNTIHHSIQTVPAVSQHIYPQLHKQISLTSNVFNNYSTPRHSDQYNSRSTAETMLFTNYLKKAGQENMNRPHIDRKETIDETFSECEMESVAEMSIEIPSAKPMKLRQVESQYAQSTPGDLTNRSNRCSKFVSKLERYIQQPNRPVESFIVKDTKKSGYSNNLHTTARFAKSVMAPNSRLKN